MIKKLGEYKNRPIVSGNNRNHKSELTEKQLVELLGGNTSGGVTINNQEKSVDITENGTTEVVADAGFTGLSKVVVNTNVTSIGGGSGWTGHADAEGLRAIGWTDEDIAYYQEHGVNWNAEDDEYHKVTEDNKALYGVLTMNNISTYKDRIVYMPKIDTSMATTFRYFQDSSLLVAIPMLNTSKVTSMQYAFMNCFSLVSVPPLDTSSVTNMSQMFYQCYSLVSVPPLDTSSVTNMGKMFSNCFSLVSVPPLDTSSVTNMSQMFYQCYSLVSIPTLDVAKNTASGYPILACFSLIYAYVKNIINSFSFNASSLLSKESLLYLINNEAATSAITITLSPYAYTRLANDADIVAALANHPNISIAQ